MGIELRGEVIMANVVHVCGHAQDLGGQLHLHVVHAYFAQGYLHSARIRAVGVELALVLRLPFPGVTHVEGVLLVFVVPVVIHRLRTRHLMSKGIELDAPPLFVRPRRIEMEGVLVVLLMPEVIHGLGSRILLVVGEERHPLLLLTRPGRREVKGVLFVTRVPEIEDGCQPWRSFFSYVRFPSWVTAVSVELEVALLL